MRRVLMNLLKRFVSDEKAAEVTELGIVLALVVAGCVAILGPIGTILIAKYQQVLTALGG